mmetsp:Transcript_16801/g.52156  ORF Transcript_16801/g.52156 Transcript_16801/m.52156 type:complete len:284 (-) Transcript_16801:12-863(-)
MSHPSSGAVYQPGHWANSSTTSTEAKAVPRWRWAAGAAASTRPAQSMMGTSAGSTDPASITSGAADGTHMLRRRSSFVAWRKLLRGGTTALGMDASASYAASASAAMLPASRRQYARSPARPAATKAACAASPWNASCSAQGDGSCPSHPHHRELAQHSSEASRHAGSAHANQSVQHRTAQMAGVSTGNGGAGRANGRVVRAAVLGAKTTLEGTTTRAVPAATASRVYKRTPSPRSSTKSAGCSPTPNRSHQSVSPTPRRIVAADHLTLAGCRRTIAAAETRQ